MSDKKTKDSLADDGLRYTAKKSGSPFSGNGNTRSCFKCGVHRTPDQLKPFRMVGKTEMVCKPSCAELSKAEA